MNTKETVLQALKQRKSFKIDPSLTSLELSCMYYNTPDSFSFSISFYLHMSTMSSACRRDVRSDELTD